MIKALVLGVGDRLCGAVGEMDSCRAYGLGHTGRTSETFTAERQRPELKLWSVWTGQIS